MKKFTFLSLAIPIFSANAFCQIPTLEMYSGAGNPTGLGPTVSAQTITFQKNINNPTGNTIGAYAPPVSVTYTLSNQQFASIEANPTTAGSIFGGNVKIGGDGNNAPVAGDSLYPLMKNISSSVNTNYTSCNSCAATTGIDILNNRSVSIINYTDALISGAGVQNFGLTARVQYADVTLTFNQPVSNPVLQLTGMGGQLLYSANNVNYSLGFSTEFDMVTPGLNFTKLSGSTYFDVTGTTIRNSATRLGASTAGAPVAGITRYGASGTVVILGTNITTFTLRMYLKGDGGVVTNNTGGIVAAQNGNIVRWSLHENFIPGGLPLTTANIKEAISGDQFLVGVTLQAPVTVSGNVFNDPNAGNVNNSTGGANVVPSGMFANLRDANGNVVFSVPVNTDGTYTFPSVFEGPYTVSLSTVAGTQGAAAPPVNIPAGWISTGEFNGTLDTGNDGTINGTSTAFTVATTNVTNINFGIQQPPTPGTFTATPVVNPGGTTQVTVAASAFSGTDPSGGTITSLRITAIPTNATTITINGTTYGPGFTPFPVGGVSVPTNAAGQPLQTITVDPIDGAVTVSIPYKVTDNAGVESSTTGAVNLPFTVVSLSGNVFNDVGGIVANANVDGTGIGSPSGTQLYANLLNAAGTQVIATVPINADGTYSFPSVTPNTNYTVQVSTNQGTVGAAPPATALPTNWVNTGEDCCDNVGSDGTVNGLVSVSVATSNVINANFGIEQLPNSGVNVQPTQPNPGGTTFVTVPASAFSGTDPDGGIITAIRITAFPTDVTTIRIAGVSYTTLAAIQAAYPNGIPTTANGQPTPLIEIDPANGANRTAVIPYATNDNAGKQDPTPGSVTLPFTNQSVVSGNLFNDIGGLIVDANVNGTGIGLPSGTQVYAYLVNGTGNVVQSVPINPDGTYAFQGVADATYSVRISTLVTANNQPAPLVVLPANWVLTGEDCCDNTGSDGTVNGIITTVVVAGADVTNINFGIEQLPNSGVNTQPSQINPGGTSSVSVPADAFSGTDLDGGTPTTMRITSFPTNATSITVNGVTYTSATFGNLATAFPNGIPVNASGKPTVPISVDPINGNVNVVIDYAILDEARQQDPTPGSVTLPFFTVNLSGNVYNDLNGLTNMTVDGTGVGSPSSTQLYANLLDATGTTVIASVPVNSGGDYAFNGIPGNTSYTVQISTVQGVATQPTPATTLPSNWVNTGENLGASAGDDGTVNGLLPVSVLAVDVTNANFGIEQLPESGTNVQPLQANPPGTTNVTVPPTAFSGTDPDLGTVIGIRITSFPTNATSITINGTTYTSADFPSGGVTVPTNASGQPTQTITVDPVDGTNDVVITYASIDNAGKEDPTPGSVTLPFSALSISGNVFDDANGITGGGNVDGTLIGSVRGTLLHANLLDATGTTVIATVPINSDGTYNFYGVAPNTTYTVQLSTNPGVPGQPKPAVDLPTQWVNTGENLGLIGSDGSVNSLLTVPVTTTNVINANFGIDERPLGTDITARARVNPGGTTQATVPTLVGTDSEDGAMGTGSTVRIDVLPTAASGILYYNGTPVTAGQVINNYDPALLTIDPGDLTTAYVNPTFQYTFIDAAGVPDAIPNTVTMEFYPPVVLRGTVYQDVDGSAAGTHLMIQTGAETGTNLRDKLYAYIVDLLPGSPTNGQIIGKVMVNPDGTYAFGDLISTANTVRVLVTTDASGTIGSTTIPALTLPTNWVNTSPLDTIVSYPANPPGLLIDLIDFGIEERPLVFSAREPDQVNPGGSNNYLVPNYAFFGEDIDLGGKLDSIRITTFPTNLESITVTVNGTPTVYTSTTWPSGGVTLTTDENGRPNTPILINPVDGVVDVEITYIGFDNAGRSSLDPATAIIPFTQTLAVDIISFTAVKYGSNSVQINWNVAAQRNIAKYEVQHSTNTNNFATKATVLASTSPTFSYSSLDFNPALGANYYRLKIVELDGTVYYSEVKLVKFTGSNKVEIFPNPTLNLVNVSVPSNAIGKKIGISVYNNEGKLLLSKEIPQASNIEKINFEQYTSGTYWIKLVTNKETISLPIIKL